MQLRFDEVKIGFDGLIVKIIDVDKSYYIAEAEVIHIGEIALNKAVDITGKSVQLLLPNSTECIKNASCRNAEEIYVSFCMEKSAFNPKENST